MTKQALSAGAAQPFTSNCSSFGGMTLCPFLPTSALFHGFLCSPCSLAFPSQPAPPRMPSWRRELEHLCNESSQQKCYASWVAEEPFYRTKGATPLFLRQHRLIAFQTHATSHYRRTVHKTHTRVHAPAGSSMNDFKCSSWALPTRYFIPHDRESSHFPPLHVSSSRWFSHLSLLQLRDYPPTPTSLAPPSDEPVNLG